MKFMRAAELYAAVEAGKYKLDHTRHYYNNGSRVPDERCAWPYYINGKRCGWCIRKMDYMTRLVTIYYYVRVYND